MGLEVTGSAGLFADGTTGLCHYHWQMNGGGKNSTCSDGSFG